MKVSLCQTLTFALHRRNLEIEEMFIHNSYDFFNISFDIALLKLADPLDLSTYTPICLPERNSTFAGSMAWVYGWGAKGNPAGSGSGSGSGQPDYEVVRALQETTVQVISNQECNENQHWPGILPSQFCAWSQDQDACTGDSGGPLSLEGQDGRHVLIGAVSFGEEDNCGGVTILKETRLTSLIRYLFQDSAGVYNNVSYFRDWIDTTMENNGGATLCDQNGHQRGLGVVLDLHEIRINLVWV